MNRGLYYTDFFPCCAQLVNEKTHHEDTLRSYT